MMNTTRIWVKVGLFRRRIVRAGLGALCLGVAVPALATDYTWLPTASNTADTPYLWNDTANWKDGKVPVTGVGSVVGLKTIPAKQYVQIPDEGLTFGEFSISSKAESYFQGGELRFEKTTGSAVLTLPEKQTRFYQPITCPGDLVVKTGNRGYFRNTVSVGGIFDIQNGGVIHLCPKTGMTTNAFPTGVWKLNETDASFYIDAREQACANRVFQEVDEIRVAVKGSIGLSCRSPNSTENGTGDNMTWLRVKMLTGSKDLTLDEGNAGAQNYVGTFAVEDLSEFTGAINCNIARLWFTPGAGNSRTPYLKRFSLNSASDFGGCRGRIGVPDADVNATLGEMYLADRQASDNATTVIFHKAGAGKLTVSNYVQDASPQNGTIDVQNGTLWLRSASGTIVQPNLIVDSDAVLEVSPDTTLTVKNATLTSPFTLGGGGRLVVLGGARPANIILRDGSTISFPNSADALPSDDGIVPAVAGNPAFWVDASKKESIEFNTGDAVRFHRWNDCRKTSEDDGYMYAATADQYPNYGVEKSASYPSWLKDPSPNKMGFVHIQRRTGADLDKQEGLYWNRVISNIRCVFMVYGTIGSGANDDTGDGGGFFLGNGPLLSTVSFDRDSMDFWDARIIRTLPGGNWYRDGVAITPHADSYRPGFQLIEAINMNTGNSAQSFGMVMNRGCGRNRICECIIYTNTVTAAERMATAEYLYLKWFRRPYPGNLAGTPASSISSVTVENGGTVEASTNTAVTTLNAAGDFTKTGANELHVSVADTAANVTVAEGRLTLKSAASRGSDLPRAWFHADATRTDTFVNSSTVNGTNYIKRWRDCNGGPVSLFTSSNRMRQPFVHANALNGLPVVDLRELYAADQYRANHCVLFFQDSSVRSESYADQSWTTNRNFRDVFVVWGSANGGSDFMTAEGESWRPFPRSDATTASGALLSGLAGAVNRLAFWRKNASAVLNPTATGLSGDYDLVSFHGHDVSNAFRSCSFGYVGPFATGGQQLAEVLVYTNALSQDEILDVEAYLRHKWFGVETPGRTASSVAGVTALAGASLAVDGALDVEKIGGAGSIVKGRVNLAAGGVIELQVNEDGTVSPLTVASPASLIALGGGTLRLTGEAGKLGVNRLAAILGNVSFVEGSVWTVENAPNRRTCQAKVVDGKLIFSSQKLGMVLIVR